MLDLPGRDRGGSHADGEQGTHISGVLITRDDVHVGLPIKDFHMLRVRAWRIAPRSWRVADKLPSTSTSRCPFKVARQPSMSWLDISPGRRSFSNRPTAQIYIFFNHTLYYTTSLWLHVIKHPVCTARYNTWRDQSCIDERSRTLPILRFPKAREQRITSLHQYPSMYETLVLRKHS